MGNTEMPVLEVFQSLWALEQRRPDGFEWPLVDKTRTCHGIYFRIDLSWLIIWQDQSALSELTL